MWGGEAARSISVFTWRAREAAKGKIPRTVKIDIAGMITCDFPRSCGLESGTHVRRVVWVCTRGGGRAGGSSSGEFLSLTSVHEGAPSKKVSSGARMAFSLSEIAMLLSSPVSGPVPSSMFAICGAMGAVREEPRYGQVQSRQEVPPGTDRHPFASRRARVIGTAERSNGSGHGRKLLAAAECYQGSCAEAYWS